MSIDPGPIRQRRRGPRRALHLVLGGIAHVLILAVWGYVIVLMNHEPRPDVPAAEAIAAPAASSLSSGPRA